MANEGTRIPRDPKIFHTYMEVTDDRQLEVNPVTTNPRWQDWNWINAESTAWSGFRGQSDALWLIYKEDKLRNKDVKDSFDILIKDVVAYDKVHKLLDKISITPVPPAALLDFEKFNIVRGTPFADTNPSVSDIELGQPDIDIREVTNLEHFLDVGPVANGSKAIVSQIKNIEVWRAVVSPGTVEAKADQFVYVGDAKRRIFKSTFSDEQKRMDAHYKARFKGKNGKYYGFSKVVVETVI